MIYYTEGFMTQFEIPGPGMRQYNKQHSSEQSSFGQSGTPILYGWYMVMVYSDISITTIVVTLSDGKAFSPPSYFDQTPERSSPGVTFCCAS